MDPSRKATGYHQGIEAFGYRSTLVRMKGWTLHLVVAYFDSGWAFEAGPNALKWRAICTLIQSLNAPWLICADCNRTPDEVAHVYYVRFLKGVVIAHVWISLVPVLPRLAGSLIWLFLPELVLPTFKYFHIILTL